MTTVDLPNGSDSKPQPDELDTSKAVTQQKPKWSLVFLFYQVSDVFFCIFYHFIHFSLESVYLAGRCESFLKKWYSMFTIRWFTLH